MKKLLLTACVAVLGFSMFAYDATASMQIKGDVKTVTKTDFYIFSKFGDYFRVPSSKIQYIYENGIIKESSELNAHDILMNKITNTYDAAGNLTDQVCFDSDNAQIWNTKYTYVNGLKTDCSEYGKGGLLKSRTIYTYTDGKLTDESCYNGDGVIVAKTISKYNKKGLLETEDKYFGDGTLDEQRQYSYASDGKLDTVTVFDYLGHITSKQVIRYAANGSVNELTTYGADNKTTERQLFKYDEKGNLTKTTTYTVSKKFGTIANEMSDMSDYVYTYSSDENAK